jgi:hypothetical protein
MSVYKKIHAVMKDVEYLQKDDKVSFGNTSYKAISEEKVTQSVRSAMLKHGLVIIPIEQEHSKEGTLTSVNVKYQIVDVDTGDFIIAVSSGTGADTQDKGVGKAMTYAYKYLMLRTFAIPTGDDPDKVSSEELDFKARQQKKPTLLNGAKSEPMADDLPFVETKPDHASEGQMKMLTDYAKKSGYTKDDKAELFKVIGKFVGRAITSFFDLTSKEVDLVAGFLKKHQKGA